LKIMQQGMVRRAEESGIGRDGKEILEKGWKEMGLKVRNGWRKGKKEGEGLRYETNHSLSA
jgi:hypothetical protein